jgi:hypothetical protein
MRLKSGVYRLKKDLSWAIPNATYIRIIEYMKSHHRYKYVYVPDEADFGTGTRSAAQIEESVEELSSLE